MKKCLIITSSIDETVDYIIEKYNLHNQCFRFDVDLFSKYEVKIGDEYGWTVFDKISKIDINYSSTSSIYYRKPCLPNLSEYEKKYHLLIKKDIITLINGIANEFNGRVLSRPYILQRAENKAYQLLYAKRLNCKIPKSFIGNVSKVLKKYAQKNSIIKPLSVGKIINAEKCELYSTGKLDMCEEDISLTPVYLQEYQEKLYEVRLTVINNNFYTVRIDTKNKVDWRLDYNNHKYSLINCPKKIRNFCLRLLKDFDLNFGTFDFIVRPDGEWIFLEINPNGQWLWLERALNLAISKDIVNYLLG